MTAYSVQEAIKNALDIHKRRSRFKIVSEEQIKNIQRLIARVNKVRAHRNTFAHYCWSRKTDDEIFGTKLSSKLPTSSNPNKDCKILKVKKLKEVYIKAYSIVEELIQVIDLLPELEENKELLDKLTFNIR